MGGVVAPLPVFFFFPSIINFIICLAKMVMRLMSMSAGKPQAEHLLPCWVTGLNYLWSSASTGISLFDYLKKKIYIKPCPLCPIRGALVPLPSSSAANTVVQSVLFAIFTGQIISFSLFWGHLTTSTQFHYPHSSSCDFSSQCQS